MAKEGRRRRGGGGARGGGGGGKSSKVVPWAAADGGEEDYDHDDGGEPVYAARVLPALDERSARERFKGAQGAVVAAARIRSSPPSFKSAQALANLEKRGGNTSLAHYNQMLGGAVVFLAISLGGAAVVISFERVPPWFLMCLAEPLFVGIMMVVQHASAT